MTPFELAYRSNYCYAFPQAQLELVRDLEHNFANGRLLVKQMMWSSMERTVSVSQAHRLETKAVGLCS